MRSDIHRSPADEGHGDFMTALILRPHRPHIGNLSLKQSYQTTLAFAMVVAVVLHFALVGVAQLMINQVSASAVSPAFVRVIPRYNQLVLHGFMGAVTDQTPEARAIESNLKYLEGLWVLQYQVSMVRGLTILPHNRYTDWCAHICGPHKSSPLSHTHPVWIQKTPPGFL